MDLESRVVLITGAKRVGAVLARAAAARGAEVAVTYNRSRDEADETFAVRAAAGRARRPGNVGCQAFRSVGSFQSFLTDTSRLALTPSPIVDPRQGRST